MKRSISALVVVLLELLAMQPANAATPTKVIDQRDVAEISVAASLGYIAWAAEARPGHFNAYVRPRGGGDPVRVNRRHTISFSVGIDGPMVVYSVARRGHAENLALYDASTEDRPSLPDRVNTKATETRPSLSGDWLLFTRFFRNGKGKIILFNTSTEERRVLRTAGGLLQSDQVNGDWATFEHCRGTNDNELSNCNTYRYQISTEELVKIPNPGKQQYAGGVSDDGTVYIVRGGVSNVWRCGHHARIIRYPVGGPGEVIATMPDGRDVFITFATDETDGSTTLYLQRIGCRTGAAGIYSIADADTAT